MGDTVRAGQLIAELDPTDYQVQLQEAQAVLVQAQAEARNAEANYERVRALFENENASLNELDTARAGAESTAALVRSVEKRLELAQLQLQYTRLTSPMSGAIADVKMEANETVSPGQPIVVLNSGSRPEVEVAVPEGFIVQIKKGSSVTVTFDAFAGEEFPAVVTEVGVAAMGSATTFPVVVRLVGSHAEIRPGMAAEVAFQFRYRGEKEQFWVPPHSVGEDREGRFIFIVELTEPGFGIARRRPVKVGELSSEGLEILEGLVDGELLIIAGVSMLEDGRQVKLPRE